MYWNIIWISSRLVNSLLVSQKGNRITAPCHMVPSCPAVSDETVRQSVLMLNLLLNWSLHCFYSLPTFLIFHVTIISSFIPFETWIRAPASICWHAEPPIYHYMSLHTTFHSFHLHSYHLAWDFLRVLSMQGQGGDGPSLHYGWPFPFLQMTC